MSPYLKSESAGLRTPLAAAIENVSINHSSRSVPMPQQLLNGSNVIATLQQVSGEGMSQRMATSRFKNSRLKARTISQD